MSIVATEVAHIDGQIGGRRMISYRCIDSQGVAHSYGPVITTDDNFDAEAFKVTVAAKVSGRLAEVEFDQVVG